MIEIELAAKESLEVLVNEIVKGVARGVAVEMDAQPGIVGLRTIRARYLRPSSSVHVTTAGSSNARIAASVAAFKSLLFLSWFVGKWMTSSPDSI